MRISCFKTAFLLILVSALVAGTGIFSCPAHAVEPGETVSLSGDEYYPAVKEALQNATSSIDLVMFFITFDPKAKTSQVNDLVQELVNAHTRGVKVRVILDQNIDFSRWNASGKWEKEDKNSEVFAYLKEQGIEVYFDNLHIVTHAKALIIDKETTVIGSSNWTESSLGKNAELSCLIRSKEFAGQVLDDISKISIDREASILDTERTPPVRVSEVFLTDKSLAPVFFEAYYDLAFDLYLLLLKRYDGNEKGSVEINYRDYYETLGLEHVKFEFARSKMIRALKRLEKCKLITVVSRAPQPPIVYLKDYPHDRPYTVPTEHYCSIPDEYWKYGWNKTLSFREKYCYLINLARSGPARGNTWSAFSAQLQRDYWLTKSSVIKGMKGLRIKNIIEIEHPQYSGVFPFQQEVQPTVFTLLDLYSPETLRQDKERLREQYGEKLFKKAQAYAEIVYKGNDVQVIEDIIRKIEIFGEDKVDTAFRVVKKKGYSNPKRSYRYVIGVIQAEPKE